MQVLKSSVKLYSKLSLYVGLIQSQDRPLSPVSLFLFFWYVFPPSHIFPTKLQSIKKDRGLDFPISLLYQSSQTVLQNISLGGIIRTTESHVPASVWFHLVILLSVPLYFRLQWEEVRSGKVPRCNRLRMSSCLSIFRITTSGTSSLTTPSLVSSYDLHFSTYFLLSQVKKKN